MNPTEILESDRWSLDAGHRALDFANTRDWHVSDSPKETLLTYADFTDWALDGRVISAAQKRALDAEAKAHPARAQKALASARQLRDALQRLFDAEALDAKPDPADLDLLKRKYAEAAACATCDIAVDELALSWPDITSDLEYPLSGLAWGSMGLLLSDESAMIGRCADDRGCGFLFLDTSKNHSRRWCHMETCGNRAKARRYYESKN